MAQNRGRGDKLLDELPSNEYALLPLANYFLLDTNEILLEGPTSPYQTGATRSGVFINIYRANNAQVQMPPVQQIQAPCTLLEQGDQELPVQEVL